MELLETAEQRLRLPVGHSFSFCHTVLRHAYTCGGEGGNMVHTVCKDDWHQDEGRK